MTSSPCAASFHGRQSPRDPLRTIQRGLQILACQSVRHAIALVRERGHTSIELILLVVAARNGSVTHSSQKRRPCGVPSAPGRLEEVNETMKRTSCRRSHCRSFARTLFDSNCMEL